MPSEQLGTDASGVAVQQVQAAGSPPEAGTTQSTAPAGRPQGRLLPVVLPVVAVNLIGSLVLDLLTGADQLIIVDGDLSVTDEGGPVAWLRLGLTVVTWLVALSAAAVAAVGARRGRAVDPRAAMVVALRDLPATALALCVAAGASVGVLWVAAGLTGAVGGAPGMVLIAGVLVALAVVGARLLLGVLTQVFGGSAWQLSRGRLLSTAGVFLLGGIGPPMVAAYLLQQLRAGVRVPVLLDLLDAALLVGTVALQANLLARNYLQPRDTVQAGLAVADLDAVDARLAALAGRRPQWGWLGAAGILLPVLLSAGLAATNPYGLPSIRTTDSIGAVAAAWPAGRHPVVVTTGGVRFCDSDLCDRYVGRHGMAVMDGWSTSTIGPDGTVVTVATTGSEQNGGPFIEYAKCTRAGCRHEFLPVRASAREKYAWPSVAGVAAPDGSVWFAVAMPSSDDESEGSAYRFSMIRCAQVPCTEPERHVVDTVERADVSDRYGRMTIGADGRPVASFRLGAGLHVITCDPVACANPRAETVRAGSRDAVWSTPAGLDDTAVALQDGTLAVGDDKVELAADVEHGSGALAVTGSHVYVTAAEATTTTGTGLSVRVGETATARRQLLWRCERANCRDPVPIPFAGLPAFGGREAMAVGPDGQVLIVGAERTALFVPGKEPGA